MALDISSSKILYEYKHEMAQPGMTIKNSDRISNVSGTRVACLGY
jgi:hypothetical protein